MSLRTRPELQVSTVKIYAAGPAVVIVPAIAGQRVGIYRAIIQASGASTMVVQDTAGGVLSATYTFTAAQFLILDVPINMDPWWQSGQGLGIQLLVGVATINADFGFLQTV